MTARRIVRFGSRVSSASGAAASKPTNASRQKTMPWSAGLRPSVAGSEDRQRVPRAGVDDQQERDERGRSPISIKPEGDADPGRDRDAAVDQPPDDDAAEDRQRQPQ